MASCQKKRKTVIRPFLRNQHFKWKVEDDDEKDG